MKLTKELLLARRKQAVDAQEAAMGQFNANAGAISTLDHLIALIDAKEPEAPPPKPTAN